MYDSVLKLREPEEERERSDENGKRKRGRGGRGNGDGKFLWLAALPADPYYWNVLIGYNVVMREGVIAKI